MVIGGDGHDWKSEGGGISICGSIFGHNWESPKGHMMSLASLTTSNPEPTALPGGHWVSRPTCKKPTSAPHHALPFSRVLLSQDLVGNASPSWTPPLDISGVNKWTFEWPPRALSAERLTVSSFVLGVGMNRLPPSTPESSTKGEDQVGPYLPAFLSRTEALKENTHSHQQGSSIWTLQKRVQTHLALD